MNFLVDIGHPGHVHLLKNTIRELEAHGHKVYITTKSIPIAKRLLDAYGFEYLDFGGKGDSLVQKIFKQISFDGKIWRFAIKHKIDVGFGSSMSIAHASKFCKMASINFDDDDDEVIGLSVKFAHPFSDARLTPDALIGHRATPSAVFYPGTHELAYLHPNRFTPDPSVLEKAGLKPGERFFIMRFVAFKAYHDGGQGGLSIEQKSRLVELLKPYGRVIITSEREIEPEFEEYRLPVPPEDIHSLLAYASMFIGDSQTMTSEAAILGVPALKCNTFAGKLSVPNELENKYGLCYSYQPDEFDKFYAHIKTLLNSSTTAEDWQEKRAKFLEDKIDVTSFFVWFIENFPQSQRILKDDPTFLLRFR